MSFLRVALRGSLPGGEVWSVNPAFNETTNTTIWNQAEGQAAADAIGALAVPAALGNLHSNIAPRVRVRVERRLDDNTLLGAAEAAWVGGTPPVQGGQMPFQTSCVISLRSNVPGGSGRGRLYWPALGAQVSGTTLRLNNPTTSAVATAAATYFDGIATALKNAFHPVPSLIDVDLAVYSPTLQSKQRIVRLEVGDILDTQNRRRDRLVEARSVVAMP